MRLSNNPDTFVSGGLILGTAEVKDAFYTLFDYRGKADKPVIALCLKVVDETNTEKEQYWNIGQPSHIAPSLDGDNPNLGADGAMLPGPFLCALKENVKSLFADSDHAVMVTHLVSCGFPKAKLDGDARAFIGMKNEWSQIATSYKDKQGAEQSKKVLVPTSCTLPGKPAAGAAQQTGPQPVAQQAQQAQQAPAAQVTNGQAAPSAAATDISQIAREKILESLAAMGGKADVTQLATKVFTSIVNLPPQVRVQVRALTVNPAYLTGLMNEKLVMYDQGNSTVEFYPQ